MNPTPKAVANWLAALPKGHPEVAAERLLDMIHEVNRLEFPNGLRIQLLKNIGDQSCTIIEPLHDKLRDITSPPQARELALAELIILLHEELALAYRIAVEHPFRHNSRRKKPELETARFVRYALLHLGQSLKVHYLIQLPPENSVWRKIHKLYIIAAEIGILKDSAADHTQQQQHPGSVEETFKAIVLMFLSAPESLRSIELDDLWRILPTLVRHTRLLPTKDAALGEPAFLIGVSTGSVPRLDRGSRSDDARRRYNQGYLKLEVAPLLSDIRHRLALIYARKEGLKTQQATRRRVLEHLLNQLEPQRKRRSKRLSGEFEIETLAGFEQVHRLLTNRKAAEPADISTVKSKPKTEQLSSARVEYNVVLNLEMVDIEPRLRANGNQSTQSVDKSGPKVRRAFCKTLNFNRDGYCLAAEANSEFSLKVGEFVAVKEKDQDRWLPANTCWVTSDRRELRFGVTLMAPYLLPGTARSRDEPASRSEACIVLLDTKNGQPSSILFCPPCPPAGTALRAETDGKIYSLILQRELARTPGYVEFECRTIADQETGSDSTPLFDFAPHAGIPE